MTSPETVTFHTSRSRGALLLAIAIGFVVLGALMVHEKPVLAWLCIIFFGLGIPVSLMMIARPQAIYLRLDADGFEMGSPLRKFRARWTDVDGFELGSIKGTKLIAVRFNANYREMAALRGLAASLSGMEGAIPNQYNASQAVVLRTLREFHSRYGQMHA